MTTVVIAGASGVVGSRVLPRLLRRDDVQSVVALGRRVLPLAGDLSVPGYRTDPRLISRAVDLQDRSATAAAIPEGVSVALCCLGTTMKQAGSKDAFRAVDHDAVVTFATAALERGATRFVVVSSIGARATSTNFYQKTKGEAEEALARLGYPQLTVLRPSLIDDEGARREYRPGERLTLPLARVAFALIGKTSRYAPIRADVIAAAMVRLAFDDTAERVRIVESDQLHHLGR
jgi:uncharacterized protein YbjT (DUF2867 family)